MKWLQISQVKDVDAGQDHINLRTIDLYSLRYKAKQA